MNRVLKWMKAEAAAIIPAVIYFTIIFNLIYFTYSLTLPPNEIRYFNHLSVTLSALIVGKVLIIGNAFPWSNTFPKKPLIHNIVWKFLIYGVLVILFWMAENYLHHLYRYKSTLLAYAELEDTMSTGLFWAALIWILLSFLCFIVFTEFANAIGKDKVKKILLG